jgi:hypothetical protein
MSDAIDTLTLLTLTTRLLCFGLVLQSIELLANARELRDDGLLGWRELRGRLFGPQGKLRWLHTSPSCLGFVASRALAAGTGLLLPFESPAMPAALAVLVATQAYCNHRFRMIHEGSDSMFLLGLVAVFAASLDPSEPRLHVAGLLFLAGQALLAYFAAGWDKLRAAPWRNGTLPTRALQFGAHRFEPLGHALARRPAVARALAWFVISLELAFPLAVLSPPSVFWVFVGAGVLFHAGVAFCMGLHGFFWSFLAAYPAFYYVNQMLLRAFAGQG